MLSLSSEAVRDGRLRAEQPGEAATAEQISVWRKAAWAFVVESQNLDAKAREELSCMQPERLSRLASPQPPPSLFPVSMQPRQNIGF